MNATWSPTCLRSQTIEEKPFVDVADLCLNLVRESRYPAVIGAAEKLGDFVINAAPLPVDGKTDVRRFVLEHGRNACRTAKIQGISLYAPHVAPPPDVGAATSSTTGSSSPRKRSGPMWFTGLLNVPDVRTHS